MAKILIIEDEKAIRNVLSNIVIEEDKNHEVDTAENGLDGFQMLTQNTYDLVLCDIKMPKMDGIELLEKAIVIQPELPIVMISGHGDLDTAVESIKKGAFDYISKPPDLNRLLQTIRNGLDRKSLMVQNKVLRKKVSKKYKMVGNSLSLQKIQEMIERVAPTDARVLIIGANGSGKELIAHAIHQKSDRSNAPMIEVNCAAIPSELIESELFGHEKGAFTSAIKQRKGKFEMANGGTLFLDEVGDMSLKAQAKVLRALQEHKISRVGSDKEIKVNVRVLAATNKDLQYEIKEGRFREDLYHRLGVILINNPSLDERKDDIPILIEHFNSEICKEHGIAKKSFTDDALKVLMAYNWSGNIRELRNVIERLIILSSDTIDKETVKSFSGK
ncbi:MAG: Fis family transcriptional regulator [Cryomorphaceae bacterium]|nr:MAG: Fis family transcriptional regulator [Cryomorphaceae bacterium]